MALVLRADVLLPVPIERTLASATGPVAPRAAGRRYGR